MCYCWWPLYGFSQTSQNTLVVLGPVGTKQITYMTYHKVLGTLWTLIHNTQHKHYTWGFRGRFYWQRFKICTTIIPYQKYLCFSDRKLQNKSVSQPYSHQAKTVPMLQCHRFQESLRFLLVKLYSPPGRRVAVRAPPQTPGFSGPLWRWPDAFGFLSPSAFSRSVSASFRSLSFGSPPVTEACTRRGPLGTATQKHKKNYDPTFANTLLV